MTTQKEKLKSLIKIAEELVINGADPNIEDYQKNTSYSLMKETIVEKLFDGVLSYDEDFLYLLKSEEFADFTIHGLKCHKLIVELRSNKTMQELDNFFQELDNEEMTKLFLSWCYGGKISEEKPPEFFSKLGIEEPFRKRLRFDLQKLYHQEESKDFTIICHKKRIRVHRVVLYARSGLFRGLFQATTNTTEVQDYSNKAAKTLKVIVKYLYYDSLDESLEDEQILVELQDSNDYYQLNEKSSLKYLLEYHKKFN
ncbi:hypothetical protein M0813_04940 [Anaeramoeba flamelloides]|uniref:BTB domain-containing protein n=1 Tax=Anaeramoeba flamelloides TaxID=1746091 RepID=A0AAV7ZGE3_9EUKA|nr:hypothetical protein M0812_13092 [Anaeramoeba flamelloides]KAJ6232417.1 hypothetical protein M0813_04940 [Anaeramoeba flamelloides]